jgi:hypothetical protein
MKRKGYSLVLYILGLGTTIWLLSYAFSPSYTFTYYQLPECDKTFTVMEIDGFGRRQVAFIAGEYSKHHLPDKDYILKDKESGFDAYFACMPTCDSSGRIIVNHYEGLFIPTKISKLIVSNELSSEEYSVLLTRAVYHPEIKLF